MTSPRLSAVFGDAAKGLADDVVRLGPVQAAYARQHFQLGDAAEQRLDERLNGNQGAVGRARVTPRFEVVRQRQVPVALLGGLIVEEAEPNLLRHLLQFVREPQIGGRVEHAAPIIPLRRRQCRQAGGGQQCRQEGPSQASPRSARHRALLVGVGMLKWITVARPEGAARDVSPRPRRPGA